MKKKILSLLTAFAMVFGILVAPFTTASAAGEKVSKEPNAVTKTVTLHKLMMTKKELKDWDYKQVEEKGYDGTQDLAGLKKILGGTHTAKEADNIFFAWQVKGKETNKSGAKQYIKKATDSTDELVKPAIGTNGEVEFTTNLDEAFGGLTANKAGIKFDTSAFKKTETYLIQEIKEKSTYKKDGNVIVDQKAVPVEITLPLVNEDGTVIDAHVYPKNTEDKPVIDKNFKKDANLTEAEGDFSEFESKKEKEATAQTGEINSGANYDNYQKKKKVAKAEVGKVIPYEVKTKIAAGTSYENLTWNDTMSNGLTFNKDLKIEADNGVTFATTDYKLVQDDAGFRLKMHESGLKKIEAVTKGKEQKDVTITLTYNATVNGTAVVDNPEKNDVTLEYGHKPGKDLEEKPVKPSSGELVVNKSFDTQPTEDEELKLVYTLKEGVNVVASVTLDGSKTSGTIDLGNGIKFEITEKYKGKFTGLDNDKSYNFSERVAGYNPEYAKTNNDGTVTITNKKDNDNPPPLNPTEPKVVVGGKKFVKTTDKNADQVVAADRLAGAKFVVKNSDNKYLAAKSVDTVEAEKKKLKEAKTALNNAVEQYNNRADDTNKDTLAGNIKTAQEAYNKAFKTAGIRYEWVANNTADGVVVLASNSTGQFEIEGLEYGSYKLEEIEAPKGYAKRNDVGFTVAKGTDTDTDIKYAGTENANNAKQVINKTVTIPQTGGIGSLIFIVAGAAIMIGAFVAYKKSQAVEA